MWGGKAPYGPANYVGIGMQVPTPPGATIYGIPGYGMPVCGIPGDGIPDYGIPG